MPWASQDMTHPKEKERVSHVIAQKTKLEELPESILNQARNALVLLRIPRSLKGFRYLTIATVLVVLVPERLERITKEIYILRLPAAAALSPPA